MTHLKKFGLKNFRVFKDLTEFEFAPITIFTGTNSSGKSSVIKALLLLQHNIAKSINPVYNASLTDIDDLSFAKGEHKAGNFELCLNRNSNVKTIDFHLPFQFDEIDDEMTLELSYRLNEKNILKNGIIDSILVFNSKKEEIIKLIRKEEHLWDVWFKFSFFRQKLSDTYKKDKKREERILRMQIIRKELGENAEKYLNNEEYRELDDLVFGSYARETKGMKSKQVFFNDRLPVYSRVKSTDTFKNYNPQMPLTGVSWFFSRSTQAILIKSTTNDFYLEVREKLISKGVDEKLLSNKELLDNFLAETIHQGIEWIKSELINQGFNFKDDKELLSLLMKDELYLYENFTQNASKQVLSKRLNDHFNDIVGMMSEIMDFVNSLNRFECGHLSYDNSKHFLGLIIGDSIKEKSILHNTYNLISELNKNDQVFSTCFKMLYKHCSEQIGTNASLFSDFITNGFKDSFNGSIKILKDIAYLEAVRANSQRVYTFTSQGTIINDLLLEFNSLNIDKNGTEFLFIKKWINEFGIGQEIKFELSEDGVGTRILIDEFSLADSGYGIIQFLPILIKIATVAVNNYNSMILADSREYEYESSIFLIEEPETNLHPALQSKLAEMFIDASGTFNIQFIIETHSEYLIRKLQYLTANKEHEYNIKPEDTVIYYFNDPKTLKKGEAQVKEIRIDEFGGLSDSFGKGFYDEATSLKFQLINLNKKQYN